MVREPPVSTEYRPRVAVLGAGFMGESIVRALTSSGLVASSRIVVADRVPNRCRILGDAYGVAIAASNRKAVAEADVIILCVKPQNLDSVALEIKDNVATTALIVSVLPGVTIERIRGKFGPVAVARLMPNLGSAIRAGFTVWTTTTEIRSESRAWADRMVGALGKHLHVDEEKYIDLATPFAAGPAFTFLFVEALIDAAVHIGLSRELAQSLIVETVKGSALLLEHENEHPSVLRARVTSPGGVTAESIAVLEERGFRAALLQAVLAGIRKTNELGKSS